MGREKEERSSPSVASLTLSPCDPSELSISPADGRARVHVPIMELLKRFRKHSDDRPPPKSITFKMQPKRRLSSQPERITTHSYLHADPFSFFFLFFIYILFPSSVTKLLRSPEEKKNTIPATTSTFYRSSRL